MDTSDSVCLPGLSFGDLHFLVDPLISGINLTTKRKSGAANARPRTINETVASELYETSGKDRRPNSEWMRYLPWLVCIPCTLSFLAFVAHDA
jgi:hypothetical protein